MWSYTVKNGLPFSRPQPVCHWLNSSWAGILPPRESLVSDIPAGDGKIVKLFYSVWLCVPDRCILERKFLDDTSLVDASAGRWKMHASLGRCNSHCTKNPDLCIPKNETELPRSQFLHSCTCEWFIYFRDRRSDYLAAAKISTEKLGNRLVRGAGITPMTPTPFSSLLDK